MDYVSNFRDCREMRVFFFFFKNSVCLLRVWVLLFFFFTVKAYWILALYFVSRKLTKSGSFNVYKPFLQSFIDRVIDGSMNTTSFTDFLHIPFIKYTLKYKYICKISWSCFEKKKKNCSKLNC